MRFSGCCETGDNYPNQCSTLFLPIRLFPSGHVDLFDKPVTDQSEKRIILCCKPPAKVGQAGGTEGVLPVVAVKPGEIRGWFSLNGTAGRPPIATYFKGDAGRIKENMLMEAVFDNGFPTVSNRSAADRTENRPFFRSFPVVFRSGLCRLLTRPLYVKAKAIPGRWILISWRPVDNR